LLNSESGFFGVGHFKVLLISVEERHALSFFVGGDLVEIFELSHGDSQTSCHITFDFLLSLYDPFLELVVEKVFLGGFEALEGQSWSCVIQIAVSRFSFQSAAKSSSLQKGFSQEAVLNQQFCLESVPGLLHGRLARVLLPIGEVFV
jgi:hypothetical protein